MERRENETELEREARIDEEIIYAKSLLIDQDAGMRIRICKGTRIIGKNLHIADGVYIGYDCILDATEGLWIGEGTVIGDRVQIYTHEHSTLPHHHRRACPVVIGDYCFIDHGVIIRGVDVQSKRYIKIGSILAVMPK